MRLRLSVPKEGVTFVYTATERILGESIFDPFKSFDEHEDDECLCDHYHEDYGNVELYKGATDAVDERYGIVSLDIRFEDSDCAAIFTSKLDAILLELSQDLEYEIREV